MGPILSVVVHWQVAAVDLQGLGKRVLHGVASLIEVEVLVLLLVAPWVGLTGPDALQSGQFAGVNLAFKLLKALLGRHGLIQGRSVGSLVELRHGRF